MEKSDYIFGIRAVIEAIESGKSIDKVLVRRDLGGDLAPPSTLPANSPACCANTASYRSASPPTASTASR